MRWRILIDGKKSAAENMAIDEAILLGNIAGKSIPTIRFYDWNLPTVSFGFNQQIKKEIDVDLVKKNGFAFVRRPTGGRAVLHFEEVTYAVISPLQDKLSGNITDSYSQISLALATGLNLMGVEVEFERGNLSSSHQREFANPCFTSSSKYELKYQNKKIVGSAQVRRENVLLQHGSILMNRNQEAISEIIPNLTVDKRNTIRKYLARKTVCINQILKEKIDYDKAVKFLINGFEKAWENDEFIIDNELNNFENEVSEQLVETKYGKDIWNFKK